MVIQIMIAKQKGLLEIEEYTNSTLTTDTEREELNNLSCAENKDGHGTRPTHHNDLQPQRIYANEC
jgi:hypothetical protein